MKESHYRMGWLVVMFDLPVLTKEERKLASDFRKWLLDDGYIMMQFSVYARPCVTYEHYDKHANRLQPVVPPGGNVKILFITDSQWGKILTVAGPGYYKKWKEKPDMPEQMEFWDNS